MTRDLLLGIDIGTTGTKCSVYNGDGEIISTAYQEYPMLHPRKEWTEQNPDIWWACVCRNLKTCFEKVDSSRIACIGVSCTNAVCLVDQNTNVLYPAIGLHDQRADHQVEWLENRIGSQRILQLSANNLAKGTCALSSIRWIIDEHPELIRRGAKFLMPSGFIISRLTGVFSINLSRLDLSCMGNIYSGTWEPEILQKAEIPPSLLPDVCRAGEIVGEVTQTAAEQTGLTKGTPVTAGNVDTVSASFGSGAIHPGDFAITIGSSGRICYVASKPNFTPKIINAHMPFGNDYLIIQTTNNAGISLRWFRDVFGRAAFTDNDNPTRNMYKRIDELAEKAGPGAKGVLYLPYLAGEKNPIWNADARGVFFNFGLDADFGTFARAVLEGVAFSIRDCADAVSSDFNTNAPVPIGGGIANSELWCQIFADVLNRPVLMLKSQETETLGDIIVAAQAVGFSSIPIDFGRKMSSKGKILYPTPDTKDMYSEQFEKYKKLYVQTADLF